MSQKDTGPVLLAIAAIGLITTGIASLVHAFYFGGGLGLLAAAITFGMMFYVLCN